MKKIFLPASIVCLLTILIAVPTLKAKSSKNSEVTTSNEAPTAVSTNTTTSNVALLEAASNLLYDSLKLSSMGLSREVMQMAYKGHQYLSERGTLENSAILAVVDFSQSSKRKRLYIIDTRNYKVLVNTFVAHGKNSGLNYAERFSNTPESLQSSLGFYVTKKTYIGKHGLSLRLAGMERGFNDNAEARAIVIHGAEYIGSDRLASSYMGRSFGCPAVPQAQSKEVINILKEGTCLFVYHPTQQYLRGSKILNS
ncbi:MAG: murein L,D-transpeptidase catalytic domain family protein [Bacteroidota bacterium]|nr:murein L,D-transpeptidase catalytic domain family protein [Bacteroidota bacterium]